uniref:39S ribosomal protein L22, mitochondrial n=1 Tax=Sinocyclocheilus grahami TaxID=75366 RepID=A0A672SWI8_SINGR
TKYTFFSFLLFFTLYMLLGSSSTLSQMSCLHTSTQLNGKHWERKNLIVYPPQQKDEPCRPAVSNSFNLFSVRQIKYSQVKSIIYIYIYIYIYIDQALTQLEFKKGAKIITGVKIQTGKYLKRIRYHGCGMFGIMDKVHCHYFVKLVEGVPPKVEQKTVFDQAKEYVEQLRNRTIINSL